jgi:hypothetical protein
MSDLPDGMVTLGGALAGFLTELEERTKERGKHGGQEVDADSAA